MPEVIVLSIECVKAMTSMPGPYEGPVEFEFFQQYKIISCNSMFKSLFFPSQSGAHGNVERISMTQKQGGLTLLNAAAVTGAKARGHYKDR